MSAASSQTPAPEMNLWERYLDLDLRAFDKSSSRIRVYGS